MLLLGIPVSRIFSFFDFIFSGLLPIGCTQLGRELGGARTWWGRNGVGPGSKVGPPINVYVKDIYIYIYIYCLLPFAYFQGSVIA